MARWTTQWFLSLQITLYLFLIFVRGNEDMNEVHRNRRNLVLEYFLPINVPATVDMPLRREKRDVEGSGEDDAVFSELNEKTEDMDNSTQNAFAKLHSQKEQINSAYSLTSMEGSGETDEGNESSEVSSEKKNKSIVVPVTAEADLLTTTWLEISSTILENQYEVITGESNTEMIFNTSKNFTDIRGYETTTRVTESSSDVTLGATKTSNNEEVQLTTAENFSEEGTTEPPTERTVKKQDRYTTTLQDSITNRLSVTTLPNEEDAATSAVETTTISSVIIQGDILESSSPLRLLPTETIITINAKEIKESTLGPPLEAATLILTEISQINMTEESTKTVLNDKIILSVPKYSTKGPEIPSSPKFLSSITIPNATEGHLSFTSIQATPEPVVEEMFKETKIHKKLETVPGNILQKENLSLGADPLLVTNTRLMDSEETVQLSSSEPKRLGAYMVIGLILLSFLSLIGYITLRKRMYRKRQEFESNQESNDTEKALLSLSDYKDNSELEENHLKNNEITPIVVRSNSQINKFEKNTNFASPKNLNTTANEKKIEKDNVLKSTAENLTQVIIEDSPKDVEEQKNVPNMEKLIVKTRIDQDSIPKKPVIINRSSTGYMPIPQDNA